MPSHFKDLVRARMQKTGESWSTAARHVRSQAPVGTRAAPSVRGGDGAASSEEDAGSAGARDGAAAFQEWFDGFESSWVEGGYAAPDSEMIRDAVRGEFGTRADHEQDVHYRGIVGVGLAEDVENVYFAAYFGAFYDAIERKVAHAQATIDTLPYRDRLPPKVAESLDEIDHELTGAHPVAKPPTEALAQAMLDEATPQLNRTVTWPTEWAADEGWPDAKTLAEKLSTTGVP
jgi:hypothetical protein